MAHPVRYNCPRCGTIATLERSGYLADKSVTQYPLEGWTYADVDRADAVVDGSEDPYAAADGVRIVCGEDGTDGGEPSVARRDPSNEPSESDGGCGKPYYLSFIRFEDGYEVEPKPGPELVELAPDRARRPRWPSGPGR